jgi:signal transduction histidine kinase
VGVLAYRTLVRDHHQPPVEALAHVAVAWAFLVSGAAAWWRRPDSRTGLLLLGAGAALLARRFQYSDVSAVFTFAYPFGEVSSAFIAHAVLSYPAGRLTGVAERLLVRTGYAVTLAFPLATLVVYDPDSTCFFDCADATRARSLVAVTGDADAAQLLRDGFHVVAFGVLGVAFLGLVLRKLVRAGPATRWLLAPLLLAAILAGIRAVSEAAFVFTTYTEDVRQALFWWQVAVQGALPLALLLGLLRARLAHAALADLIPELERAPPDRIRDLLARALRDPTLRVAFRRSDGHGYVDADGGPVDVPDEHGRGVTTLRHGDEPLAVLLHDPALTEEPELVEAAAAAATLALENARLQAQLQAQLVDVKQSRARLVAAADSERRRIERDLHDGTQQRLLALGLTLQRAARAHAGTDADLDAAFTTAVGELRTALEELRELTHGTHPTSLAAEGLAAALADAARRAPVPVEVAVDTGGRLPPVVEAAAYFVVSECLANVAKHAGGSRAAVRVARGGDRLTVEVSDDGRGGADPTGSGLRGLADRVEALGGTLVVTSPRGDGTTVRAELPCAL